MERAIVAMGGGPTRVINRSLFGVVDEAARHGIEVLAARHGISGVLNEDFTAVPPGNASIDTHKDLPGACIGSARMKPNKQDCQQAVEVFKKQRARYFFYIGGNDTAEATSIINREALAAGYELRCFHVPKTIDNDLVENDHCPGYGSAARYVAHAILGDDLDVRSLPGIKVNVIMGRKAGWLAAAAALCRRSEADGPHLIYLPECGKSLADVMSDILEVYQKYGRAEVVCSEGLNGPDAADFIHSPFVRGELSEEPFAPVMRMLECWGPIEKASGGVKEDGFGHTQLSGTGILADVLAACIKIATYSRFGKAARCRADTFGYLQRCYPGEVSSVDAEEAEMVGRKAVQFATSQDLNGSIALRADRQGNYRSYAELIDLEAVAGKERQLPDEFINADGNGVTEAFVQYALPLVGTLLR